MIEKTAHELAVSCIDRVGVAHIEDELSWGKRRVSAMYLVFQAL
jgi:hypothetical protein